MGKEWKKVEVRSETQLVILETKLILMGKEEVEVAVIFKKDLSKEQVENFRQELVIAQVYLQEEQFDTLKTKSEAFGIPYEDLLHRDFIVVQSLPKVRHTKIRDLPEGGIENDFEA